MDNAQPLPSPLARLVRLDGAWMRCKDCDAAYWGSFRSASFVLAKAQRHAAKAHGAPALAEPPQAGEGRPQRRNRGGAQGRMVALPAPGLLSRQLGRGIARIGFELGPDTVLKIAHDSSAWKHNLAEWRSYQAAPAALRKYLAEPLACGPKGEWLVIRRAVVGHVAPHKLRELEDAIGHFVGDLHSQNVGMIGEQVVAVDYAGGWNGRTVNWAR